MSADPQPTAGAVSGSARADDALRESSAFQRAILECADYAIISTGPDGAIRTFNRAAERMLGYRATEVIVKVTPEAFHDREEVARRAAELTEELGRPVPTGFETLVAKTRLGRAYEQEWTWVRKDGSRFPVQLSMTAMLDEARRVIGFLGIAHDITRRRVAQSRTRQLMENLEQRVEERSAQLEASQQRYETLATIAPVGIYHCDPAGQCSFVNQRWCDITGCKREDALGGGWSRALHPEDHQRVVDEWTRAVQEGRPFQLEYRFRTPAGAIAWVYGQAVAERDASGCVVSYVGTITDITEFKTVQMALQESEQRFRGTVEQAAVGVSHVGLDGRWLLVNDWLCNLIGYPREELMTKTFQDITHPDDLEADLAYVRQMLAGKIPHYGMDKRYFHKDGSLVWIRLTVSLVRAADGAPKYFISIIQDIRARKVAEEALQQVLDGLEQRVEERTAELGRTNMLLFSEVEERKTIEAALRDSEARLRTIIDSTTDLIFIKDPEHRYRMVNEVYAKAFRMRPEDILGKNDLELGLPAELITGDPAKGIRGFWADDREVMDSGQMKFIPEEPGMIAGHPVFLSTVKVPLRDATGKVTGVLGYVRDITERKAIEAERERLIQKLQAALAEVKTLSGLLPVCGWCKKIRDDSGYWNSVEGYLKKSSGLDITHGICPECSAKMIVDLAKLSGTPPDAPPTGPA